MIEDGRHPIAHPGADIERQLQNYRLTTAEIIYRLPDHPAFLQSYIWQELDIAPRFPVLKKFLRYWEDNLEGQLFRVTVANHQLITPGSMTYASGEFWVQ